MDAVADREKLVPEKWKQSVQRKWRLILYTMLLLLSSVGNQVYFKRKEVAFRNFDGDLDVNVLQFWVASFQFVTNFVAMPIYALKVLGPQQVPISEMPQLIVGGTKCLFFLEDQVRWNCGLPGEKECDHCSTAWTPVVIYLSFNILYNVFTMLVIKHGSAALSFLVATLRMPLASLAFASPSIMGSQAVQPGFSDLVSLILIICGLVTYRWGGRELKRQMRRQGMDLPALIPGDSPLMSPRGPESPSPPQRGFGLTEPLRRPSKARWTFAPLISTGLPVPQPAFVLVRGKGLAPRTADRVRHDLYHRLGAASPLASPQLRHLAPSPPVSPNRGPMEPEFVMECLPDTHAA